MLRSAWTKIWLVPDAAPLAVAIAVALGLGTYTGVRTLLVSPEVFVDKDIRNDEMAENAEWFEKRSEISTHSPMRRFAQSYGRPHVFPNDYMSKAS